jgi:dihydrofolate reductase
MRKLKLFIATSLDGYIATTEGNIDWLSTVEIPNEDYGYQTFIESIDTVIVGRKTYEKVLSFDMEFPYLDKKCYVITHTEQPNNERVTFYNGNIKTLIHELKNQEGKDIFCDGGAEIVNALMKHHLIDEYIISIIPVFLGNGIRLFKDGRPETFLKLTQTQSFPSGLVQLRYEQETF